MQSALFVRFMQTILHLLFVVVRNALFASQLSESCWQALLCAVILVPINNSGNYNLVVAMNTNLVRFA